MSSIYQLDEFLGISFIQFPPHFKIDKIEKLDRFLKKLPHDLSFAVELRYESWFSNDKVKSEWFDLFSRYNITPVITDTSGRRDVLHQIVTNDKIFVRFTGNNLHATDYKRIDDWIQKITDWLSSGISEFYFFLHEPTKHLCADIAIYMAEKLKKSVKIDIQKPHIYTDNIVKLF